MRTLQISGIIVCMHLLGSAVLFGYVSGAEAMKAAPLLGLFGWFFVFPELIGVGLQWILYEPYPKPSKLKITGFALLSALAGGVVVGLFTPKEQGNEPEYFVAGLLAGAAAATFSFICIHLIKSSEYKSANKLWNNNRPES